MTAQSGAAATPKVVATDLDGTIVRSDGSVSARTRRALQAVADAGAHVVFVTGRPPRWLAPIVDQTGHRGVAICANGAIVYDLDADEVVAESPIAPDDAMAMVTALRAALPDVHFAVERGTGFGREPGYEPRAPMPPETEIAPAEQLVERPVAKLLARHDGLDADTLLAQGRAAIGDLGEPTHSSTGGLLEIGARGVSKGTALARWCEARGIAAAEVVAFGDMPNDVSLLRWAGRGIAVANAHPETLAAVGEVTASNDDDGVAVVLESLFG